MSVCWCRSPNLTLINNLLAVQHVCVGRHKYTHTHTQIQKHTNTCIVRHIQVNEEGQSPSCKLSLTDTHTHTNFSRVNLFLFHLKYLYHRGIFHGKWSIATLSALLCSPPPSSPLISSLSSTMPQNLRQNVLL